MTTVRSRTARVPAVARAPHPAGLVAATVCAAAMTTPSLIPRDWIVQGVVSGVVGAAGYGVAAGAGALLRRRPGGRPEARDGGGTGWRYVALVCAVVMVVVLVLSAGWQRRTAALTGMPGPGTGVWLCAGPAAAVVAAALVLLVRAVRDLVRRARGRGSPRAVRVAVVVLVVAVGAVGLAPRQASSVLDAPFAGIDDETFAGDVAPASATRSGSSASLVPLDTLGREGRRFVAGGPSAAEISEIRPVVAEPIRAYAGLDSAPGPRERAALAVAELERTGAFDRRVLVVMTTTGTGWVNTSGIDALEMMYGGDVATVATQYSYLPSWLSFVVDRPRAAEAGRLLLDDVRARIARMPRSDRPRLLVGGESLGSLGSESAFASLEDLREQTDGAVYVGPTQANELWRGLVDRRDPGSPAVAPVYDGGRDVRFAADRADLGPGGGRPAVVYLQHPSDPVVAWTPDLLWHRPDRLAGPRGADVDPAVTWVPVLTFLQVSADLMGSKSVPHGHGHNYDDLIPAAWATVAAPEGWTGADTDRLLAVLPP
ncbi:MAG: alpha/beta-hydrolase family protein [Pseudonocardia sediminis]